MASFGRLRVAFRGAMAFSFHCFMCSGMPLTARDTTALFSAYCSYRKSYAMGMWGASEEGVYEGCRPTRCVSGVLLKGTRRVSANSGILLRKYHFHLSW